ncbi:MAG: XrtA system polysaccharide deacetylase [Gemmataceae bacterium]
MQIVLSFDIEEHDRIEAASGLAVNAASKRHYRQRMDDCTRWLLEALADAEVCATFFVVGQIAVSHRELIRDIAEAGHEVASHGWDHRRVLAMSPAEFADDIRRSKEALEQAAGTEVVGYRAPTFSVVAQTAWALDVLAEAGMTYDSSIYPVRHDRYGVPDAPREPFLARGERHTILELPPATYRVGRANVPMGGGGYFRLFPLWMTEKALRQTAAECRPAVATLYFHPWEFDPDQERLPLGRLSRFRTYVGVGRTRSRLTRLLAKHRFARAIDVAEDLKAGREGLAEYCVGSEAERPAPCPT